MFRIISLGLPLRQCQAGPETGTSVSSGNDDGNPGYKPSFFPRRVVKASLAQDDLSTISGLCGAGDPSLFCMLPTVSQLFGGLDLTYYVA